MSVGGRDADNMHECHAEGTFDDHACSARGSECFDTLPATVQRKLEELSDMSWMDDILRWRTDFDDLLHTLNAVLG